MFLEHNSNIVLKILDIIMLCKHNVTEAYFIWGICRANDQYFALLYSRRIIMQKVYGENPSET